jgi:hypothetical protein
VLNRVHRHTTHLEHETVAIIRGCQKEKKQVTQWQWPKLFCQVLS